MKYGHVTGEKKATAARQAWYDEIQQAHLAKIEEDERHAQAQALARQIAEEAALQAVSVPQPYGDQLMSPEALCSVNVTFTIADYGKAQATGRGATPQEAVANLTGTMAATIAALDSQTTSETTPETTPTTVQTTPRNRYEKLGRLITCGLQKAEYDPHLQERFMKAVQLVALGYVSHDASGNAVVRSQTRDGIAYTVDRLTCVCPDGVRHRDDAGYHCKHVLAVLLTLKLDGLA